MISKKSCKGCYSNTYRVNLEIIVRCIIEKVIIIVAAIANVVIIVWRFKRALRDFKTSGK